MNGELSTQGLDQNRTSIMNRLNSDDITRDLSQSLLIYALSKLITIL
jgi:hypothetical protein